MASLYEMTKEFETLFDNLEAINDIEFTPDGNGGYIDDDGNPVDPAAVREDMQQAWFDTLDGMEQDIQKKAEAVAVYCKNISAEAAALKEEEAKLRSRRQSKERTIERMKEYLMNCLSAARLSKVDMPRAVISIRNNAESVNVSDENAFIGWAETHEYDHLLRYHAPDINKTAVKDFLKSGNEAPGVELTRGKSVVIK